MLTTQNQELPWGWRETYQEDQTMQEQGVEESNSPGNLVWEDHTALKRHKNRKISQENR